jgi:hypothetical protein
MRDLHFTPIHEHAKASLNISRDEYALCNYVEVWSAHPDNPTPGWCNRNKQLIADWVGISKRGLEKMINRLMQNQLLSKNGTGMLKITKKWFETVNLEKMSANSEQSSHPSAASTANKVRTNSEQSSHQTANKVRTNNKYNSKNSKIHHHHQPDGQNETETVETEGAAPSPQPPAPSPSSCGPCEWAEGLRREMADATDMWRMVMKRIGVEADRDGLLAWVDDFEAQRVTGKFEYNNEGEYRKHFKNYASKSAQIKKDKTSSPSSFGPRQSAMVGRRGVNGGITEEETKRDQLF